MATRFVALLRVPVLTLTIVAGCRRSIPAQVSSPPIASDDPRADFRPTPWEPFAPAIERPSPDKVVDILCDGSGPQCEDACAGARVAGGFAECVLSAHYREDRESLALAQQLFDESGALVGIEPASVIDGGYLGDVTVEPLLPTGTDRHHLRWIVDALRSIDGVMRVASRASKSPVLFRTRPQAFLFYRTETPSYPSAFATEGVVHYNLRGPLLTTEDEVEVVLFHELFHLNDEGHGGWADRALADAFAAITETCGADDACLARYAPDDTKVDGGTYYAFDPQTGSPSELAAEIAARWFREHRAIATGSRLTRPYKCGDEIDAEIWSRVVGEFFGGADEVGPCGDAHGTQGDRQ